MEAARYNEIEPYAVAWLRNLIAAGHIAPGVVDDRSIKELAAADLAERVQCHFFAGIGVWSHSLRLAGWPDDVPVWTGSCPCQPFSAAGRGAGLDDERHLWPDWYKLILQCLPPVIFGEQVASPAGLAWLDLVRADLEAAGYAFAVFDLCAASVGAPHIRQRLYFVAIADVQRREGISVRLREWRSRQHLSEARGSSAAGHVADAGRISGLRRADVGGSAGEDSSERIEEAIHDQRSGAVRGVADTTISGRLQGRVADGRATGEDGARPADDSVSHWLDHASGEGSRRVAGAIPRAQREGERERQLFGRVVNLAEPTGHVGGFWRDAEWVLCRDGKARPIEPGTFPLANGAASRVGRLHAYGNAICGPLATEFIKAVIDLLCASH